MDGAAADWVAVADCVASADWEAEAGWEAGAEWTAGADCVVAVGWIAVAAWVAAEGWIAVAVCVVDGADWAGAEAGAAYMPGAVGCMDGDGLAGLLRTVPEKEYAAHAECAADKHSYDGDDSADRADIRRREQRTRCPGGNYRSPAVHFVQFLRLDRCTACHCRGRLGFHGKKGAVFRRLSFR